VKSDLKVAGFEIADAPALDRIAVYTEDHGLGRGRITITCYDSAWTAYFGAMPGGKTILDFVESTCTDYFVSKFNSATLKNRKVDQKYLARIVEAIKAELRGHEAEEAVAPPQRVEGAQPESA